MACASAGCANIGSIGRALANANPHASLSEIVILADPIKFLSELGRSAMNWPTFTDVFTPRKFHESCNIRRNNCITTEQA